MHKLLLADDSVTIQRVIELTFSGEDVQVVAVSDGEQAIARIPLERPDVVLADIGMPRKGGYDVAAFVKGRPDLAHIPVLLLAGAFEPVDQARAEQVGADGVLIKPFEPRQVIERVKELLALVPQAPVVPEPALEQVQPVREAAPEPVAAAGADGEAVHLLDELFESLNQALFEPSRAARPAEPETVAAPEPPLEPSAEFQTKSPVVLQPEPEPERAIEPEPFVLEPPVAFEPLTAAPTSNGATLDDYFDRLSVAFEQASVPAPRPFQSLPDRREDLAPPVAHTSAVAPPRADAWPAQEWLSPAGSTLRFDRRTETVNPILEAVTALMTQGPENGSTRAVPSAQSDAPSMVQPPPAAPSQAMVDVITERVLARLAPEVAETLRRLVVQEIARSQHDAH